MTTFKQFISQDNLTEAVIKKWFTTGVDVDTAMSVLNTYAKDGLRAIQNSGLIYRAFAEKPAAGSFVAMDSSTGVRTSRDTDNLYQLMLASSEALKGYADRGNSFICSTSKTTVADLYGGHMFVMVPLDGTNIVASRHSDYFDQKFVSTIYTGSPNTMEDLSLFILTTGMKMPKYWHFRKSDEIDAALSKLSAEQLLLRWDINVQEGDIAFEDYDLQDKYDSIVSSSWSWNSWGAPTFKILEKLSREIVAGRFTSHSKSTMLAYELFKSNKNKRFTALSTTIMTPETAGLTLVKYGDAIKPNVECWFSGKCIAISYPVFAQILTRLQEQGFPIHKQVLKDWKSYMKTDDED